MMIYITFYDIKNVIVERYFNFIEIFLTAMNIVTVKNNSLISNLSKY